MTDLMPLAALADAATLDLPSYDDAAAEAASARQI